MKIATINNFSNVEEKGMYYLEGFAARNVGGQSLLSPSFQNNFVLSEDTSLYSNLGTVQGADTFIGLSNENGRAIMVSTGGYLHYLSILGADRGQIHQINGPSNFQDIRISKNENVLYTTQGYLGVGWRGTATGGSTTTLVDTEKNFGTLGMGTTAGINKVYDLTNSTEYTVTSITTTTNTNDTLNFSAGSAVSAGHIYIAFSDKGALNSSNYFSFDDTTALPQFGGQESVTNFRRQIEQFDTEYFVGNGNFLASLNEDDTTWNDNYKQFPPKCQFQCMATNQGRILISTHRNGKGVLLLWDGFSDGYLSIQELNQIPTCIKAYGGGWLLMMGDSLLFSDGYQTKHISKVPDTDDIDSTLGAFYNSMLVVGDRVFINIAGSGNYNRAKSGTWLYEFGYGWTLIPQNNVSGSAAAVLSDSGNGAIFSLVNTPTAVNTRRIFTSFTTTIGTHRNCLNRIVDRASARPSAMFYLKLPRKMNVSEIVCNLSPQFDQPSPTYGTITANIAVADGKRPFWRNAQIGSGSSTTSIVNPSATNNGQAGVVGCQVRVLDGDSAGERSYITAIANAGLSNETLTISPALSATPATNGIFNILPLKLADTKTFSGDSVPDEIPFTVEGFYSDKLYFEIYFNETGVSLDIVSIDIYGS